MQDNKRLLYGCGSDMELLQFMRSKGSERFSRVDAFCDLVGRITGKKETEEDCSQDCIVPFHYGTFQSSVSELADKWKWHRATVRNFLDKLEELGYLKKQLCGREYMFYMRLYTGISIPVKDNEHIRTIFIHLLANYELYELSNEQLAAYIDMYYMDIAQSYSGTNAESDLARHKAILVLEALSDMAYSDIEINDANVVMPLIVSSFEGDNSWTWSKWTAALKLLDVAFYSGEFPKGEICEIGVSSSVVNGNDFTDEEIRLLKEIYDSILKCAHNSNKREK